MASHPTAAPIEDRLSPDAMRLLVRARAADTLAERVSAVRAVAEELPHEEGRMVLSEIGSGLYAGRLTPPTPMVPWTERFLNQGDFVSLYGKAHWHTQGFSEASPETIAAALESDPRTLLIFRMILGYSTADLASVVARAAGRPLKGSALRQFEDGTPPDWVPLGALSEAIAAAVSEAGSPKLPERLRRRGFRENVDKPDTRGGWGSVARFARDGVPYEQLLYQRWYGGLFSVVAAAGSEIRGNLLEDSTEDLLIEYGVPHVRPPNARLFLTKSFMGERLRVAPDFVVHDHRRIRALVECKFIGEPASARKEAARFAAIRDEAERIGADAVIAVVEGLGWIAAPMALGRLLSICEGRVVMPSNLRELIEADPIRDLTGLAFGS